jgi:hypothetical protein
MMKAKDLKNRRAKSPYGEAVTVFEVNENMERTGTGMYHTSKLFIARQSIYSLLNETES